jgi:hypothetical protein
MLYNLQGQRSNMPSECFNIDMVLLQRHVDLAKGDFTNPFMYNEQWIYQKKVE